MMYVGVSDLKKFVLSERGTSWGYLSVTVRPRTRWGNYMLTACPQRCGKSCNRSCDATNNRLPSVPSSPSFVPGWSHELRRFAEGRRSLEGWIAVSTDFHISQFHYSERSGRSLCQKIWQCVANSSARARAETGTLMLTKSYEILRRSNPFVHPRLATQSWWWRPYWTWSTQLSLSMVWGGFGKCFCDCIFE